MLIKGNASVNEEEGKLLLSELYLFEEIRNDIEAENKELWLCFEDEAAYNENEKKLLGMLELSPGRTVVMVMLRNPRSMKRLGNRYKVCADEKLQNNLKYAFGDENVLVREIKK